MIKFTHLSALQKFIRRNYPNRANDVATKLYTFSHDTLFNRIYVILFEDIGLANVNLVKKIVNNTINDYHEIIKLMCNSNKSRLCSYLTYIFRDVFIYGDNKKQNANMELLNEPFPDKHFDILDSNVNHETSIKIAGSMFLKGMDKQFWELIYGDLFVEEDRLFAINLEILSNKMCDENNRGISMLWVFAILWRRTMSENMPEEYDNTINEDDDITEENPDWVFDQHTSRGKSMGRGPEFFFNESIKVNKLESFDNVLYLKNLDENKLKNDALKFKLENKEPIKLYRSGTYCKSSNYFHIVDNKIVQIEPGYDVIKPKVKYSELTNKMSLSDLGILQIPYVNKIGNRPYVIYCWLEINNTIVRFSLKSCSSKNSCQSSSYLDSLMNKYKYKYNWCNISKIIQLEGVIINAPTSFINSFEHGIYSTKKTFYIMSIALPYFLPVTVGLPKWKKSNIQNEVILINLMKYIFNIADRTARNIGIYIYNDIDNKRSIRLTSFDHGLNSDDDKLGIFGKLGKLNLKSLSVEKEWLLSLFDTFSYEQKNDNYIEKLKEVISKIS